jgi:hypothetical protein
LCVHWVCSITKGYKCLDLNTNKIYVSRHVVFDESTLPFKNHSTNLSQPSVQDFRTILGLYPSEGNPIPAEHLSAAKTNSPTPSPASPLQFELTETSPTPISPSQLHTPATTNSPLPHVSPPQAPSTSTHPMITRTRDNTRKPRQFSEHIAFLY